MLKTFNCGLGLIFIIDKNKKKVIKEYFRNNKTNLIYMGKIKKSLNTKKVIIRKFLPWI